MNRQDIINTMAEQTELSRAAASRSLEVVLRAIMDSVASGESVTLTGFGQFLPRRRNARNGRNPRTGVPLAVKETVVPVFKPGATFKTKVAGYKKTK